MKERELKEILRKDFNFEAHWKPLFLLLFSKVQYFSNPSNPFSENEKVKSGKQTGIVKLDDGKSIAIFEVEVDDSIRIDRNRQGLREIAIKHIDQNITHGAFVFFYSKNQADYRFSFIAKWSELDLDTGEFKKGETKPKRYTYLLGDNEACTTAAKRLLILIEKRNNQNTGIKEIIDAFSVESLNKEFFKTYKEHYEKFWRFIANPANGYRNILLDTTKEKLEKQEKPIRDFVKKLLGRIVFLHFLQKKGWMGCPANTKKWENGEKQFMQLLFADFSDKSHFHSQCLTKLFFNTLNTRRPNDIFEIKGLNGKLSGSRVPYLNGGLFDADKPEAVLTIDFPERYFAGLLEFFEQYNFTIDENSPDDHEVGIDPEMLGHIFENLLEENREKGAFYTPKEVVQYMCKESIVQYLKNSPPLEGWSQTGVVNSPPLEGWSKTGVVNRASKNYFKLPFNPKLKARARALRKAGNLSEVLFWNQIKNKQFKGFDFDRQKIVGNYIVDFFCTNCNVVIEIDGSSHDDKQEYDALRDVYLESLGLTVIHIDDLEVKKNLAGIMEMLFDHPALSRTPPKEGNFSTDGSERVNTPTFASSELEKWEVKITSLIRNHDASMFNSSEAQTIDEALNNIKVCDPAIGSGAFQIGILQEIFEAKRFIYPYLKTNKEFNPAQVKKDIIQKSIYGVDLEKGAVDIAQLRFWLALVVDEENPHPLPNLDYKIMQGNSLLESFEGIDLSKAAFFEEPKVRIIEPDLFGEPETVYGFTDKNRNDIKELVSAYFIVEDKDEKAYIKKRIDKIVTEHIDKSLEGYENQLLIEIAGLEASLKRHKEFLRKTDKTEKEIEKRQKLLEQKGEARKKLLAFEHTEERPYFLWHLFFMDVFENGGFDVIIGNPPYIQLQKMGKDSDILQEANFKTYRKTGDIYTLFYEKGLSLLKPKGTLTYITSNTWMRTNFGEGLREFFITDSNPEILLNFEDTRIFPTATVEVNIMVTKKESWNNNLTAVAIKGDYLPGNSINDYLTNKCIVLYDLDKESWVIVDNDDFEIKNIIESKGLQLKDWKVEMNFALKSGYNDAFFINEETKNRLIESDRNSIDVIKPLLRGRNIKKYSYKFDDIYILYIPWHFPLKDDKIQGASKEAENAFQKQYPAVYNHLLSFKAELSKRNKAETGIRYEWYALQRASSTFAHNYEKDKIVWLAITDKPAFAYDDKKIYVTSPSYIMVSECPKYHLVVLNSKLVEWYLDKVSSSTGQGTNQWTKIFMDKIPIPQLKETQRMPFETMAEYLIILNDPTTPQILEHASNEIISQNFEEVLNMMVYELYFEEHMIEREIDVLQFVNFPDISKMKTFEEKRDVIQKIYYWLKEKDNPIRNRILVSESRSWIIKRINKSTH